MYQKGGDAIKRSNELIEEGEFTAALWDRVVGAAHGYLALESGRCSYTYDTRGYEGLVERLKNNGWLENEVRKVAARMREQSPQTLDQLSVYLIACDAFLEAVTLQRLVQVMLNSLPEEESKETLNDAYSATSNQIAAWLDLKLVADYLDMMPGYEGQPIPVNAPWRQVSDYLRRASNANMAVFDTVVVEPAARHLSMSADLARARLMKRDKVYAIIRGAEHLVFPELGNYFGDSDAWGYAFLATSMYTHTRAAGLLAKYVSLDAELNDDGFVIGLKRERLLADWLTYSEDQTRRNIALLQESGVDASPVAQMYSLARIQARRKVTEQMEALVDF
jgi:hypothetical protein